MRAIVGTGPTSSRKVGSRDFIGNSIKAFSNKRSQMNKRLQNNRLKKLARAARPWAVVMGIILVLKVTGAGSAISTFTGGALMKTGVLNVKPDDPASVDGESFNYDFSLKDMEGNKLEMTQLKGKVIFLNLWATWCGPCRVEMPSIQELYNSIDKDKVVFVMLSLDQESQKKKIERFVAEKQFTFPVYLPATPLPSILRVNTIPTTFIIGADGKVKTKRTGMANYNTPGMKKFLNELAGS